MTNPVPAPVKGGLTPAAPKNAYSLPGPQVAPDASYWHVTGCPPLCVVTPDQVVGACDLEDWKWVPGLSAAQEDLDELHELASLRDDPTRVASFGERPRSGLSQLLQYRPPAAGLLYDRRRPNPEAFEVQRELEPAPPDNRVVMTGRELARFFECEVPGNMVRRALDALVLQLGGPPPYFIPSPPMISLMYCALDVTIYSAQLAAWFMKWRGGPGVEFRPRPIELDPGVSVLYDRAVNAQQSGDGPLRNAPTPSPGTPRHPSYPSGHSTTYAAIAVVMGAFLPDVQDEFDMLADNAGMARLWAGVHYRSDHDFGVEIGRCVGQLVLDQLQAACLPGPGTGRVASPPAPAPEQIEQRAKEMADCCAPEDAAAAAADAAPA